MVAGTDRLGDAGIKTEYTVGFLHDDDRVVLIKKNRPTWQAGSLNGVGGHVEPGESALDCQVREFLEETGVAVPEWDHFLTLEGTKSRITCFAKYDDKYQIPHVRSMTDERVGIYEMWQLDNYRTVPNLSWIIPLMQQRGNYHPIRVDFHGED